MEWDSIVKEVRSCRDCKSFPLTVKNRAPWNEARIFDPRAVLDFSKDRTLFLSEAPPGGTTSTFFQRDPEDGLRKNMFSVINDVYGKKFESLDDFFDWNCYLLPSFCFLGWTPLE